MPSAGMTTMTDCRAKACRPLRIVHVASHGEVRRGGAVQMVRLAVGLRRRGHPVVCTFNRPADSVVDDEFADLLEAGVNVVGFDLDGRGERARFRRWCKATGATIVHAHRDDALVFTWSALRGLRQPLLVAGRGTVYPLKRFSRARLCFRSRKVRRVIAVAQAVKRVLVRCGVRAEKIEVVYGGVEEDVFCPGVDGSALRSEWGIDPQTPLVGNVAALVGKKGHDVFFHAAAKVRQRIPSCRFVCVGAGKVEKFTGLLAALELKDAVVFAGHRSDMPRVLAALDVVVSSSTKGEGLNGAIRDAMSCARPVVATDVAGNGELVRDSVNGRLVPARAPEFLADAIVELLRDRKRAGAMGAAGRVTILEGFTNRVRCERMEQIYQSLVSSERA